MRLLFLEEGGFGSLDWENWIRTPVLPESQIRSISPGWPRDEKARKLQCQLPVSEIQSPDWERGGHLFGCGQRCAEVIAGHTHRSPVRRAVLAWAQEE